ncbi:tyrosine decarboxylase-like [Bidens hawaiensis]|uniref:tyrosine decarboxylase-like n=1 Tax=Bidens hawaiensis TaxID=980011 RepID=UPI0040494EC5
MDSINVETTSKLNPLDPDEFRKRAHLVIDFIADYLVCSQVKPGFLTETMPKSPPLQDVQKHIIPGITHWQSPGFFAYFQSNASIGNFLGEMLITGFNTVGFNWWASPAATELEMVVLEWVLKLLQLPKSFWFSTDGGGVIHGSTCESFVCTLIAAREKMLSRINKTKFGDMLEKLVVYCSDQTHFSLRKACRVVGINPEYVRAVVTTKSMNYELSSHALLVAIESDVRSGLVPLYVCLTVGTTQTTATDPLGKLCEVANRFNMWVHVDAAYAGSACICPEFRHFLDGVEGATSFSFNPHKWFLTTLDCCCLWVKDRTDLTKALSTNLEYLKNKPSESKQVVDYKDWQISLSRRFKALKLWMVMKTHGASGLREFIRKQVKMAKRFERLLSTDERFEVVVPRNFATVCFRISPSMSNQSCDKDHMNRLNKELLESLNRTERVYMTHAVIEGVYVIRVAIGATLIEDRHVSMLWDLVQEQLDVLLAK